MYIGGVPGYDIRRRLAREAREYRRLCRHSTAAASSLRMRHSLGSPHNAVYIGAREVSAQAGCSGCRCSGE